MASGKYHGNKPGLQCFRYVADGRDDKTPPQALKLYSRPRGV